MPLAIEDGTSVEQVRQALANGDKLTLQFEGTPNLPAFQHWAGGKMEAKELNPGNWEITAGQYNLTDRFMSRIGVVEVVIDERGPIKVDTSDYELLGNYVGIADCFQSQQHSLTNSPEAIAERYELVSFNAFSDPPKVIVKSKRAGVHYTQPRKK